MIDNIGMLVCNFAIFYAVFQLIRIEIAEVENNQKKDKNNG